MAKKKILIIDDESDLVEMVSMRLRASGFEVVAAYDGEEGLRAAGRERPDLILLDLVLPKIRGEEIRARLRRDPELAGIPVILLTAKAQGSEPSGGDPFVRKPFDPQTLLGAIRDLLMRGGPAPS